LTAAAAASKARLLGTAAEATGVSLGGEVHGWFVPGRIEVLGKHTDYAGGRSLLCAAERGMCVVAAPAEDDLVVVMDAALGRKLEFRWGDGVKLAAESWENYVGTTARRLLRNFGNMRGARIAINSDLPRSAGLSSSSVLVVAMFLALADTSHLYERPEYAAAIHGNEELAAYLGCVENGQSFGALLGDRGVGTFGGSEDHTAMLCCRAGEVAQYRFCPVVREGAAAMPAGMTFAIASSGVTANKTGPAREAYNRASRAAAVALEVWNAATRRSDPTLFAAATHAADAAAKIRAALDDSNHDEFPAKILRARFDQFYREAIKIVPAALAALHLGDIAGFGKLVDDSQRGAERGLHNQIPETVALARSARELGAHAASAFGAGFGGSVWALVPATEAAGFIERWRAAYQGRFPGAAARSEFFVTPAGPGVIAL